MFITRCYMFNVEIWAFKFFIKYFHYFLLLLCITVSHYLLICQRPVEVSSQLHSRLQSLFLYRTISNFRIIPLINHINFLSVQYLNYSLDSFKEVQWWWNALPYFKFSTCKTLKKLLKFGFYFCSVHPKHYLYKLTLLLITFCSYASWFKKIMEYNSGFSPLF